MNTVRRMIWILVVYSFVERGCCQEGYLNQDLLRLQQYSDGQGEGYSTNFQREPSSQLTSGAQYVNDDVYNTGDYSRAGRSRKVYRIKNPFQHQEEERSLQDANTSQDSGTAASNQYSALQYSLPPEEFLQQMRAESQYQQQQQLQQTQQQFSTQVPASPYTATPQPQYQYSTLPASNYDINQQSNQFSTLEPKSFTPGYQSNTNTYQFSNQNSYNTENAHSTPLPPYMSTSLPNNQYLETPANNYASSSSSLYVSSPQSSQQYVSSPFSNIHSATYDYNNNRVTTVGSNSLSYENNNDVNKRMQIDHYDNAATGIRYPDMHSQYQNNFPSTTASPTSTPYTESPRDFWQSSLNSGYNALSKPEQNFQTQYQNFKYNQQEGRYDTDSPNSDNHRIGSLQSANNIYLNYAQPDYQFLNSLKDRARDAKTELGQQEMYSHGDYGWKLSDKKSSLEPEISTNNNFFKYQIHSVQPDTGAVSQMSFQMDSRKPYNFDQNTKPVTEKSEVDEFTKAAAKAHENYKQQQQQQQSEANKYLTNNNYNSNLLSNSYAFNSFHNNEKQRHKLYNDHSNLQGHTQNELVTASPFFYMNPKDTADSSHKQPFDHDKALKNIVPIDVSNVVQNSDSQTKFEIDLNNRYSFPGFNKEQSEQNVKQYSRPDPYYNNKDRDTLYAFNLKSKLDDSMEKLKQFEQSLPYYAKHQTSESIYNFGSNSGNKRFVGDSQQSNLGNQLLNHQDNTHSSANIQQQQRPQFSSDILKFSDIPYRLTPSLNNINFGQSNIPSPLPVRINQNVDNHNVDITAEVLAKLLSNKQNMNRPEIDSQSSNLLSINGFRVANPFNVDLKLVADMLKGKPAIDDSQMTSLRGDINKPLPMDISQLQQFMQFKNDNNILGSSAGLGSYLDIYSSGRLPYQGVKYSRSEEDTENIPITDSSNNHPIGAVVEEDAVNGQEVSDLTENSEDSISANIDDERPKSVFSSSHKTLPDRHRLRSSSYLSRHSYKRKYPKAEVDEPYPLLKPPPPRSSRYRGLHMKEKNSHRRRVNKPKMLRVYKTEPLFESDDVSNIRRSLSVAEEKSDIISEEEST
nr:protein kinase 4-like [Maniola hyperantus]